MTVRLQEMLAQKQLEAPEDRDAAIAAVEAAGGKLLHCGEHTRGCDSHTSAIQTAM